MNHHPLVRTRTRFAVLTAVLFFFVGALWSVISPPGSAADDAYHLTSTWCAWGDSDTCIVTDKPGTVLVPDRVTNSDCFWSHPGGNASCSLTLTDRLVVTDRVNPRWGVYPPGFYMVMRAFVGDDVNRSVILMRVFNSAIAAAALLALLLIARPTVSRAALLAWVAAFSPMAIYFIASTNPSSWVITGIGTFWAFLLTFVTAPSWRSSRARWAGGAAIVAALLALSARADSILYLSLSTIAVAVIAWPHVWLRVRRHPRVSIGAIVAALLVATIAATNLLRYLNRPLSFPGGNFDNDQPPALVRMLVEFPAFLYGVIGGQEPSWTGRGASYNLDLEGYSNPGFTFGVGDGINNPSISGLFVAAVVAGLFFIGFTTYTRRKVIAVGLLLAALTTQVIVMRAKDNFGFTWLLQPRWFIPLALVILGISLLRHPLRVPLLNGFQRWLIVVLISVASFFSYTATLWRYTVSQENAFVNLNTWPIWWWDTPVMPISLVICNGIVVTAFVIVATWVGTRGFADIAGRPRAAASPSEASTRN